MRLDDSLGKASIQKLVNLCADLTHVAGTRDTQTYQVAMIDIHIHLYDLIGSLLGFHWGFEKTYIFRKLIV